MQRIDVNVSRYRTRRHKLERSYADTLRAFEDVIDTENDKLGQMLATALVSTNGQPIGAFVLGNGMTLATVQIEYQYYRLENACSVPIMFFPQLIDSDEDVAGRKFFLHRDVNFDAMPELDALVSGTFESRFDAACAYEQALRARVVDPDNIFDFLRCFDAKKLLTYEMVNHLRAYIIFDLFTEQLFVQHTIFQKRIIFLKFARAYKKVSETVNSSSRELWKAFNDARCYRCTFFTDWANTSLPIFIFPTVHTRALSQTEKMPYETASAFMYSLMVDNPQWAKLADDVCSQSYWARPLNVLCGIYGGVYQLPEIPLSASELVNDKLSLRDVERRSLDKTVEHLLTYTHGAADKHYAEAEMMYNMYFVLGQILLERFVLENTTITDFEQRIKEWTTSKTEVTSVDMLKAFAPAYMYSHPTVNMMVDCLIMLSVFFGDIHIDGFQPGWEHFAKDCALLKKNRRLVLKPSAS
jgi:hypothetical protein